ncbi:hypothetical protein [Chroococcidiopsis sp.]|uniref:hypothetical protein n=1 Tax=Chroococcidiopsis sp. TaxID=3088168 RepID=UPI003F2EBDA2
MMAQNTVLTGYTSQKLLLPGSPLIVCPELVTRLKKEGFKRYATDAAVFLQQLHYFLSMPSCGTVIDGVKWVYNSLTKWQQAINWLTDYAFRTIKNKLVESGIIKAQQLGINDQGRDRSYWYAINYEHKVFLQPVVSPISTDANNDISAGASNDINPRPISVQCADDIETKITPENTSKKTTTLVAVKQKLEQEVVVKPCTDVLANQQDIEQVEQNPLKDSSSAAAERSQKQEIDKQIGAMGIKQNDTIDTLIDETDNQILRDAIAAAAIYIQKNFAAIENKAAVVVRAIKGKWQPNRPQNLDLTSFTEINRPTNEQLQQLRDARDRGDISEIKMLEVVGQSGCKTFHVNERDRWIPWTEYLGV